VGQPQAPTAAPRAAPHANPLPAEAGRGDPRAAVASGAPNPDGPIWHGNAFHTDAWTTAAEDGPLPDAPVILPKRRWLAERARLAGRNAPLGLRIEPGEAIDDIAADLARFALIALSFPKFSDGRAFSTATLLGGKFGFRGELRAVGNVLSDQIPYMRRVGFDSFEVAHAPTRRALAEGRLAEVKLYYQPATTAESPTGTRPWLRRDSD
jgi:phosphoadenosine phosphosulfate reductase